MQNSSDISFTSHASYFLYSHPSSPFVNTIVIYDQENNKVGIKMRLNDTLFINSGIKIALDTVLSDQDVPNQNNAINMFRMLGIGIAGLYVNKSGMGNKGWDVRACLVDEDYSGYMHLSIQYLWYDRDGGGRIYVGDKLTQGTVQEVKTDNAEEVSLEEYNKIMANSKRGADGFGSSDVKH
jgi:dUTPase